MLFLLLILLAIVSFGQNSIKALSLIPDILTYKTCVNSPPGFSPGCMDNVTVYPGDRATFSCQVDVRCHIQSLYWYHENLSGEKRLIQTARNSTEPYMYTINQATDLHRGRYFCIINNVMGQNECSAHLVLQNSGPPPPKFQVSVFIISALGLLLLCY